MRGLTQVCAGGAALTVCTACAQVEGAEHVALQQMSAILPVVGQLLLEIHLRGCHESFGPYERSAVSELYARLEAGGMRCFSLMPNLNPVSSGRLPSCAEASFINLKLVRDGWAGHLSSCAED